MIILDLVQLRDIDDIGIMDPGKGQGKLCLDVLEPPVGEYLKALCHHPHVFLPAFKEQDLLQKDLPQLGTRFDKEVIAQRLRGAGDAGFPCAVRAKIFFHLLLGRKEAFERDGF